MTPKYKQSEKINWTSSKLKAFVVQKKTTQREKYFMFDKNLVFRIHKELLNSAKKKKGISNPIKKCAKDIFFQIYMSHILESPS